MLAPYQPPQSAKGNNFSWPQGGTLGRDECRDAYIREALGLQSAVPVRPTIVSQSFILPTALSGRAYNQEEAAMPRDRQSFGVGDRPGRRGFLGAAIGGCVWCELSRRSLGQQPAHGPSGGTSPPHWSYEGEAGAGHWGELSADFKSCEFGVQQSPIDLADPVTAQLGGLDIAYHDMRAPDHQQWAHDPGECGSGFAVCHRRHDIRTTAISFSSSERTPAVRQGIRSRMSSRSSLGGRRSGGHRGIH